VVQIAIAGVGVVIAAGVVLVTSAQRVGLPELLVAKGLDDRYFNLFGAGPSLIL
jgi:hypothetical protein